MNRVGLILSVLGLASGVSAWGAGAFRKPTVVIAPAAAAPSPPLQPPAPPCHTEAFVLGGPAAVAGRYTHIVCHTAASLVIEDGIARCYCPR